MAIEKNHKDSSDLHSFQNGKNINIFHIFSLKAVKLSVAILFSNYVSQMGWLLAFHKTLHLSICGETVDYVK